MSPEYCPALVALSLSYYSLVAEDAPDPLEMKPFVLLASPPLLYLCHLAAGGLMQAVCRDATVGILL